MARILISDDSPTEVLLFQQAMQAMGHETVVARDGLEAEAKFLETAPDLVILDVVMPKKDGFQVCRKIKSDPRGQNIPVIIVSTRGQESDRYWGMRQGAHDYMVKPIDSATLLAKIAALG